MSNEELCLPYGQNRFDCDFTIGSLTYVDGRKVYGIHWYAHPGVSYVYSTPEGAEKSARLLAERMEISKPIKYLTFDVYRKRGKHWQYIGSYDGVDSRQAARKAGYIHNLKVLGVRPQDTNVKLFVYRFEYTPTITG